MHLALPVAALAQSIPTPATRDAPTAAPGETAPPSTGTPPTPTRPRAAPPPDPTPPPPTPTPTRPRAAPPPDPPPPPPTGLTPPSPATPGPPTEPAPALQPQPAAETSARRKHFHGPAADARRANSKRLQKLEREYRDLSLAGPFILAGVGLGVGLISLNYAIELADKAEDCKSGGGGCVTGAREKFDDGAGILYGFAIGGGAAAAAGLIWLAIRLAQRAPLRNEIERVRRERYSAFKLRPTATGGRIEISF